MKKNLFLLFSIYFFVVQPLVIGILRGQANFFRLGAINLVAIILIGILYAIVEEGKTPKSEENDGEKRPIIKESKVAFHDHFHSTLKDHKKKHEFVFPTLLSFAITIIFFFMFQYNSGAIEMILMFALALGFIVFLSLTLLFKHRITKTFRGMLGTKIYLVLLVISIALTAYDYYQVYKDYQPSISDYIAQNFLGQERIPTDGYIFTGEGTLIGTGLGDTTGVQDSSSDVFSGITTDVQEETGTVLGASVDTLDVPDAVAPTTIGNQKLMDAVIYLLKKYEIPLITTKDISFTYVTTKNPYYAEWRTAYTNKMIGKTTNPSKYIVCESYIVMKGLLEKRPVVYTASNVLTKFRAEAEKRDALNGCVKGKIVTDKTL